MQQETVRETVLSDTEKNLIKQRNLTQKIIIWSISENIKSTAFDINVKFNQGGYTMKKRLFSVLLATAMVASMATGATCTTVSAAEKKTIKFFHRFPDEPFNSFIEDKIAQYEEEHPDIDIVVESAQNDPYKEKLKVVVGRNRPDLLPNTHARQKNDIGQHPEHSQPFISRFQHHSSTHT